MAITISVDMTHPKLLGLDAKKVRFNLGPSYGSIFHPYSSPGYPSNANQIGNVGTNKCIFEVGGATPIVFSDNADFLFLGNVDEDTFQANRTKAQLVHLMRAGYIIVEKDGAPLTPEDVAIFAP